MRESACKGISSGIERVVAAVSALTLSVALVLGAAGCANTDASSGSSTGASSAASGTTETAKHEVSFVDQNDNEVTVQVPCERMVVLQHHSLDMLAQMGAQDNIVGVVKSWPSNLGDYMNDVFPGIADLPTPGDLSEWNVEQIAALNPDVVIAAAQAPEDAIQQVRDLGIPVVVVTLRGEGKQEEAQNPRLADADAAYTEGCEWAVKTLGMLSGKDEQAEKIWEFCEESRELVDEAVGDIADDERPKVVVISNGIAYGNDKYVGCQLLRAGAVNAAALAGIQGNTDYNAELLATWDPDIIITQDRYPDDYTTLTTDPQYAELAAVKSGNVIEAPYWTKPWGNPDADSIALGELWLAHMLYPDKVPADLVQERAEKFYEDFYGIEFTDTVE